ncbi:uncharacterized protein BJX67DRAFT_295608 [Aspergillus lucknowensis]|uniref:NAD(P)-binding protein n=1 Tax=Aspergillus lucknowensis TaxID=176173 RepID=A0ABR4LDG6_9EURO
MSDTTIVLVTGAARGLGKAFAQLYLSRPKHIVIGTVRDPTASNVQSLRESSTAEGSRLHLFTLESSNSSDYPKLISGIKALGINHLDLVIANAGFCPQPAPLATVSTESVLEAYNVNAVGPFRLFQAARDLLKASPGTPKWVSISSGAGSIAGVLIYGTSFVAPYGMSKAAMNWHTLAIHQSEDWLISFAVHPGLVQTDMGNAGARVMGLEEAPNTIEEAITKTTATIDAATREATSGKFWNVIDGTELPL